MSTIRNAVIVSDLHCGCQLGLCPNKVTLDEGGTYHSSTIQKKVKAFWDYFFRERVPLMTRGEPYVLVVNGDAIDGSHHGSTHQISHNIKDQMDIAYEILAPQVEKAAAYYHIRGTEVHVGKSGCNEDMLATRLGASPDAEGRAARYQVWLQIGEGLAHILHHIGTTGSNAYESTALTKELAESYTEAGRWGRRPPDVVVRSHRHRAFQITGPSKGGYGICCTTPGWQLKTPFTHRIPGARVSEPQFGGIVLRYGDEDGLYSRSWVKSIGRSKVEVVEV